MVPLPGIQMAVTTRNLVIAAQLSAAARLDAILAFLKDDIAEIKSQMIEDGSYCEKEDGDWKNKVAEDSLRADKNGEMVNSDNQKSRHQILEIKSDKPNAISLALEFESKVSHTKHNSNPLTPPALKPNLLVVSQSSQSTHKIPPQISYYEKPGRFLTCKLLESGEEKGDIDSEQPPAIEGYTHDKVEIAEIKRAIIRSSRWGPDAKDKSIARPSQSTLAYGWVYEAGQITIEWLIAWHNCRIFDLRTSCFTTSLASPLRRTLLDQLRSYSPDLRTSRLLGWDVLIRPYYWMGRVNMGQNWLWVKEVEGK